jgi:hypothetical protein
MHIKLIEVSRPDLYARRGLRRWTRGLLRMIGGRLTIYQLKAKLVECALRPRAPPRSCRWISPLLTVRLEDGRVGELRLGVLTKEANAERDLQRSAP